MFVKFRNIQGKKIIAKDNEIYELDDVSFMAWELFNGERSIIEVSEKIAENYNQNVEIVKKDIDAFVEDLLNNNLVNIIDDGN